MYASLGRIPHGVHEDGRQEFGENNAHSGAHQFVSQDLGEELRCLLPDVGICGIAEEI